MSNLILGRPNTSEYPPYAAAYVNLVVGDDILGTLAAQLEEITALLKPVGDRRASEFSYAPGKWTLKQIVGHMIDTERIFAYRALCVARNDATPLPGYDDRSDAWRHVDRLREAAGIIPKWQSPVIMEMPASRLHEPRQYRGH